MNAATKETTMSKKLVTLPVNGMWQAVHPGHPSAVGTAEFWAFESRFSVMSQHGTEFHGKWETEADAYDFACSLMGRGTVKETTPYWYAPAYGVVSI